MRSTGARQCYPDVPFDAAWRQGRAMSLDAVVALALGCGAGAFKRFRCNDAANALRLKRRASRRVDSRKTAWSTAYPNCGRINANRAKRSSRGSATKGSAKARATRRAAPGTRDPGDAQRPPGERQARAAQDRHRPFVDSFAQQANQPGQAGGHQQDNTSPACRRWPAYNLLPAQSHGQCNGRQGWEQ